MVTSLKENVEELESTIAERDEEIASLKLKTDSETLNKSKFEAIINFIKTIEDVDDNILNFMESVIETNNENEINYLLKLSGNFMKQTNKPPTFKKVSMINQVDSQSLERFNNILNNDVVNQSNNESTKITDEVSKTVNSIAELF
jgi:Asp-tRNA(Asn)/Glu-tRNA(Gln) amidotransferase C subunit